MRLFSDSCDGGREGGREEGRREEGRREYTACRHYMYMYVPVGLYLWRGEEGSGERVRVVKERKTGTSYCDENDAWTWTSHLSHCREGGREGGRGKREIRQTMMQELEAHKQRQSPPPPPLPLPSPASPSPHPT